VCSHPPPASWQLQIVQNSESVAPANNAFFPAKKSLLRTRTTVRRDQSGREDHNPVPSLRHGRWGFSKSRGRGPSARATPWGSVFPGVSSFFTITASQAGEQDPGVVHVERGARGRRLGRPSCGFASCRGDAVPRARHTDTAGVHGGSVGKEDEMRVRLSVRLGVKRGPLRNGVRHLVSVEADVCRHLDHADRVVQSLDGVCDLLYKRKFVVHCQGVGGVPEPRHQV